ncbi:MAG: TlpA family protein disulfide reductase [Chloroflexi bacterium]|nr:TlpA family protein disulfide reductase [Chloroflexota bacterium]MCL5273271.1 TlpA family protein disulfide reductase [Chloroflexota bacterium]
MLQFMSTPRVLRLAGEPTPSTPSGLPLDHNEGDAANTKPDPVEIVRQMPKVGSLAPDFTLRTIDGVTVTLNALRGHPVMINFWASWCVACRAEAPELQKVYVEYADRGLVVLGVNITPQDTLAAAQAYVNEFKLTFPIPMDEKGDAMAAYHVPGLPTSFFIDPNGVIRDFVVGQMDRATMLEGLGLTKPW